jgi:hypothetical protein
VADGAIVELCCVLGGRLSGHLQALRQILGALGASPADRSKVPPVEAEQPYDLNFS